MQVRYQLRHRPKLPDSDNWTRLLQLPGTGFDTHAFAGATGRSTGMTGQSFHKRSSE